jgi:DNA-directed RNA polymerase subunit alpha
MSDVVQTAPTVKDTLLSGGPFGPAQVKEITDAVSRDFSNYRLLREGVMELEAAGGKSPANMVRLGVAYFLIGRFQRAITTLEQADGGALALYYLARASFASERYGDALKHYDAAAKAGYDKDACAIGKAETLRYQGKLAEALKILDDLFGPVEQTADYLYQRGSTISAMGGNPNEVVALFSRAVESNPRHAGALLGLAIENDRRGNDDEALKLYERSNACFPTHVGALINLGVIYEDRNEFEKAAQCYQRILEAYPDHPRARLFLKDAQASGHMMYDEDAERRRDRMAQVLSVPVTDFELSVRSRNCLQKMGIMTLGDLVRCSEAELLASKNFGETSLMEIKEMLSSKGLQLGQGGDEKRVTETAWEPETLSPDEQVLLERPIADLNLSVRARKCMIRLGINTIGELLRKTGDDLLECKNFGVTSLTEVREKLTVHGLKLRGE